MPKSEKNRAQRRMEKRRNVVEKQSYWTTTQGKIVAGVIGALVVAFVVYGFWPKSSASSKTQTSSKPAPATSTTPTTPPAAPATPPPDPNAKLEIKDVKVGTGAEAKTGDTVTVHYTGTLTDGSKFDSSVDKNQPLTFQLGAGRVIKGWEDGIVGMKVGGKRKLVIPPHLGYAAMARPGIPANSTLNFDVELLKVESAAAK